MKTVPRQFPDLSITDRDDPRIVAGWDGERTVFRLLCDTSESGVAIFRKRLRNHPAKQSGEADFVLVIPAGVFVLEVKAGKRLRYDPDSGDWFDGDRRMTEAPWDQADGNSHAIRAWLEQRLPDMALPLVSWGVVLVNVDFPRSATSIDAPAEAVMDARQIRKGSGAMKEFLNRLSVFQCSRWRESGGYGRDKPRLDDAGLKRVIGTLAPDWDLRPSLSTVLSREREALHGLTQRQFELLHYRSDISRQIVEGGAGTGKTFVALELARQRAEAGETTTLVARSPGLARYLRSSAAPGITVASIDELAGRLDSDSQPMTEFLVVDEGQDLLEERVFEVLERTVVGGLDGGQWWWFMDCNNQSGMYGAADHALADYLRECAAAPPFHLDRNCRNTREIVEFLGDALAADLGTPKPEGSGLPPRMTELPIDCPRIDLIRRFRDAVSEHLDDESLDPGQLTVVVVGCITWAEELVSELDRRLRRRIRRFAITDVDSWPPHQTILYATAEEIKGLENDRVLVMTDPDSSCDMQSLIPQLYVALTRARVSLHWIIPASILANLEEFVRAKEQTS